MTTYNVRVSRSDAAEGPFTDYFGKAVKDTTNNFPILTAPYRFENHTGWAGTAHCAVFSDNEGNYFMAHQGRLSPQNQLMVLHIRQLFFTPEGWPVASPERYAGTASRQFSKEDLVGEWEIIRVQEPAYERRPGSRTDFMGRRRTEREGVEPVHPNDFWQKTARAKGR